MFVLVCASALMATGAGATGRRASHGDAGAMRYLAHRLHRFQATTWHWQKLTGRPLTQTAGRKLAALDVGELERTIDLWAHRARTAHRVAQHPPHMRQWMCIHHYEGAWTDVGGPYWGGLQMSRTFQARYGAWLYKEKGTADHWTPLEQIWTAEKALKSRGFWPWPNSARLCGLI
jgi:hypothetical protein